MLFFCEKTTDFPKKWNIYVFNIHGKKKKITKKNEQIFNESNNFLVTYNYFFRHYITFNFVII